MNRQHKVLLLILAMVCVFSLCIITAAADEAEGRQPDQLLILTYDNCKTEYIEGELFNPTGFRGYVLCVDPQYSFYIGSSALTYLETEPLTRNVTEITFVYENLTFKIPITVTPDPNAPEIPMLPIVGFEASSAQTDFLALQKIDPSVLTIELIHPDGSRTAVDAASCTINPSIDEPISAYVKALTITYSNGDSTFSDVIEISVTPILRVELGGLETATLYEGMTPAIPSGITAKAVYDEMGAVSMLLTDYVFEYPYDTVKPDANGKTTMKLIFDAIEIDVEATVASIVSYTATGLESAYYYGDTFYYSNARFIANYSDGSTRDITEEVSLTAPSTITANSQITAIYNGTDIFPQLGIALPQGTLTVVTPPAKLQYEIGESFDASGLTVAVEYSDGVRRILTLGDYTVSIPTILTSSDRVVTLEYFGITEKIGITVGNDVYVTNLYILGSPDVMNYFEGDFINISGVVIEAYYSDGTYETIDPRILTFTPSLTTPLTVDVTSVKISVGEGDRYREVSYQITVKDKHPTFLVPNSQPSKLQYAEGEKFDPDGLALRLYFNDDTYIVPSTYTFSPELGTPIVLQSNTTEKYIIHTTYEYEGVTYSYPIEITVTPAKIENLLITRSPVKTVYEIGEQFDPAGLDIIIIYEDRTLPMSSIPEGYYTVFPSVITETTKEITFSFRGKSVSLPITVNGVDSSEVTTQPIEPPTTEPITPPETTQNTDTTDEVTTQPPEVTTDPEESTEAPEVTTELETTTSPDVTTSPNEVTTDGDETTDPNAGGNGPSSFLYLWIIVIVIIVAALVALIIYYKKNFT